MKMASESDYRNKAYIHPIPTFLSLKWSIFTVKAITELDTDLEWPNRNKPKETVFF